MVTAPNECCTSAHEACSITIASHVDNSSTANGHDSNLSMLMEQYHPDHYKGQKKTCQLVTWASQLVEMLADNPFSLQTCNMHR